MAFAEPIAFLLTAPWLCAIAWLLLSKKPKGAFFYSSLALLPQKSLSLRASLAFLPKFLIAFSLIFIIIALARPQTSARGARHEQKGLDIMIIMDVSLSMLIEDMGGMTRLEAAKKTVRAFIEGRPNDRAGLILFAGESFSAVPLTFDHEVFKAQLERARAFSEIKDGTAIGVALANGAARLKLSPPDSRIIVFLTDGENNTGFIDPETALEIVKRNKIKVYAIGLGRKSGAFPIKREAQDARGRKFYRRVFVKSQINTKLMKKMSDETGGSFFMAKNLGSLKKIFNIIDKLETYKIETHKWTRKTEHFKEFLSAGALLYFLSALLSITVFFKGV